MHIMQRSDIMKPPGSNTGVFGGNGDCGYFATELPPDR